MTRHLFLTSFNTWQPHQPSNASDDLVQSLLQLNPFCFPLFALRKLPVSSAVAIPYVLSYIAKTRPSEIVCCGMAESRQKLTVELRGTRGDRECQTIVDLDRLISQLQNTEISHDAGNFVCNDLYYSVLNYLGDRQLSIPCLFVHVPVLTPDNTAAILTDFINLIRHLRAVAPVAPQHQKAIAPVARIGRAM